MVMVETGRMGPLSVKFVPPFLDVAQLAVRGEGTSAVMLDQGCEGPPQNSKVTEVSSKASTVGELVRPATSFVSLVPEPVKNCTTNGP